MSTFERNKPIIPSPISPTKTKIVDITDNTEDQYDTVTESAYGLIEEDISKSKWHLIHPKGTLPQERSNHSLVINNNKYFAN